MHKLRMYRISIALLITALISVVGVGYVLFFPIRVMQARVQPYKVLTKKVEVGSLLVYQIDGCKYMDIPAQVQRNFIAIQDASGSASIQYPGTTQSDDISTGCHQTNVATTIPLYLSRGIYYIDIELTYKVNPLHTETYHFTTDTFQVTRKDLE